MESFYNGTHEFYSANSRCLGNLDAQVFDRNAIFLAGLFNVVQEGNLLQPALSVLQRQRITITGSFSVIVILLSLREKSRVSYASGVKVFTAKESKMQARASATDGKSPQASIWQTILPMAVASVGPAYTVLPVALAVSWFR